MKQPVKNIDLERDIFAARDSNFNELALAVFHFQYEHNTIYRKYCDLLHTSPAAINSIEKIPFLPISFFKTHSVISTSFEAEAVFESSGTSGMESSRHHVKKTALYEKSFIKGFEHFYGAPSGKCILGLLPSYLERGHSSLVYMVNKLAGMSQHKLSGFYLDDFEKLRTTILHNEILKQPTLLIGVTYALLDFAEQNPMQLRHTIIMETGGMKGRREEITRRQVHGMLQQQLGTGLVHSEYGMTELLSQAYSKGDGIFHCSPWMKILIRDEDDPFAVKQAGDNMNKQQQTGCINIIDLANIYSCSFIATEDTGRLFSDGSFEVLGRMDNSDARGCSLMAV
ncbi:MAG: acyl transferase [Ferruginibacter sp.]